MHPIVPISIDYAQKLNIDELVDYAARAELVVDNLRNPKKKRRQARQNLMVLHSEAGQRYIDEEFFVSMYVDRANELDNPVLLY